MMRHWNFSQVSKKGLLRSICLFLKWRHRFVGRYFFLEGFYVAVFFCFYSYIYESIACRFFPYVLIICSLTCLFALLCLLVSVFLALLVFLFAFSPKLGCIDVLRVYLRIVKSLNITIISIPFASVWRCWQWSLKGKSMSDR